MIPYNNPQQSTKKNLRAFFSLEKWRTFTEHLNNPEDLARRGDKAFSKGRLWKALGFYKRALLINPEQKKVLNSCGLIFRELNEELDNEEC